MDTSDINNDTMPESCRPPLLGEYTMGSMGNLDAPHSTTETPAPSDSDTALRRQGTRTSMPTSQSSETKKTWKERFRLAELKSKTTPTEGSSGSSQTGFFGHLQTPRMKSTESPKQGSTPALEESSLDQELVPMQSASTAGQSKGKKLLWPTMNSSPTPPTQTKSSSQKSSTRSSSTTGRSWTHGTKPTGSPHSRTGRYQSSTSSTQTHPLSLDTQISVSHPEGATSPPEEAHPSTQEKSQMSIPETPQAQTPTSHGSRTTGNITPTQFGMNLLTTTSAPMESATEIYAAGFKPLLRTEGETGRPPSPSSPTSSGPWENTEKSQHWPTSSSTIPSIQSGTYSTGDSKTSPEEYETRTVPSPIGEVPTYQRDRNTLYYHDPRTSPSISGLKILKPASGTAGTHGSGQPSPTTATGSHHQTLRSPRHIPDQLPNPVKTKTVAEMGWLELLEWQERSLANKGSWLISEAAEFMYRTELPNKVHSAIYEDEVKYHAAKLWNQLHNDHANILRPFEQRSYPPYHWAVIPTAPKQEPPSLPPESKLIRGAPAEGAQESGDYGDPPTEPVSQHAKATRPKRPPPPPPMPPMLPYNPHHDYDLWSLPELVDLELPPDPPGPPPDSPEPWELESAELPWGAVRPKMMKTSAPFTGASSDVKRFLNGCEDYFNIFPQEFPMSARGYAPSRIMFATSLMEDKVLEWWTQKREQLYDPIRRHTRYPTWPNFDAEVRERFWEVAEIELKKVKWKAL
ncbi:uncharacterized protein EV420DRAFT_1634548 [Desarmillaria tabescens]|uniref:Uncharacterized protein n=1 Tax=Armillaria tabescens TaxID=1929756 RepID=A0AA39NQV3_ARMTA|nr:uncharacterized protein EV420DRAFT_1634548 [Desarmillaria tabescens]KAK0470121.1 hypothetical protein EV420DRAFT_1634548 [Desarmillaria tabescens]